MIQFQETTGMLQHVLHDVSQTSIALVSISYLRDSAKDKPTRCLEYPAVQFRLTSYEICTGSKLCPAVRPMMLYIGASLI